MALLGCGSVFAQQGKQAIGGNLSYGTEIESIGDSCYNLARTINRKHRSDMDFTPNSMIIFIRCSS